MWERTKVGHAYVVGGGGTKGEGPGFEASVGTLYREGGWLEKRSKR